MFEKSAVDVDDRWVAHVASAWVSLGCGVGALLFVALAVALASG
jgi:hypothetical protein